MNRLQRLAILIVLSVVGGGPSGCAHIFGQPGDGWSVVHTPHFTVYTDLVARYHTTLARLEEAHAAISKAFFPGVELRNVPVLLFSDSNDFQDLFGPWKLAATVAEVPGDGHFGRAGVIALSVDRWPARQVAHRFVQEVAPAAPFYIHEGFAALAGTVRLVSHNAFFAGARAESVSRYRQRRYVATGAPTRRGQNGMQGASRRAAGAWPLPAVRPSHEDGAGPRRKTRWTAGLFSP